MFSRRKRGDRNHKVGHPLATCKPCNAEIRKEKQGPETHWLRYYGLTSERAQEIKESQEHVCAVCHEAPKRWYVDHCHETGKIRGLCCQFCNSMLGFAKDRPDVLEAGARYLRERGN